MRNIRVVPIFAILLLAGCAFENKVINPLYVVHPLIASPPADVAATAVTSAGNAQNLAAAPADADAVGPTDKTTGIPGPIYLERYKLPGRGDIAVDTIEDPKTAADDATAERNELKSALVAHSNIICFYTEGQILGNSDIANFGFGATSAIAGALGSIFTDATPARVFSGISGVSSATQNQVNQVFFKSQLTTAILQKIDSTRAAQLTIINNHNTDPISKYSLNDMLADVLDYHNKCSFYEGIESIVQSANNASASDSALPSGGGTGTQKATASTNSSGNVTSTPVTNTGQTVSPAPAAQPAKPAHH